MSGVAPVEAQSDMSLGPDLDLRPPGEAYFRHPGDAVRLAVWGTAALLLFLFIWRATATSEGVATDLGDAATQVPRSLRGLALTLTQVAALVMPAGVVVMLAVQQRWRRLGVVVLAVVSGAAAFAVLNTVLDLARPLSSLADSDSWVASPRFPSLYYVSGAAAAATVGKPWLSRSWRRTCDTSLVVLGLVMAVAGSAGVPELLLANALGVAVGAAVLIALGAPNRRPSPAAVGVALREAGLSLTGLSLERAEGGRAQLYVASTEDGRRFVKVNAQDSRDADLLYRGYRMLVLRGSKDDRPSQSLASEVEHEALLLLLARRSSVTCPAMEVLTALPDGSVALALEHIDGRPLDSLAPDEIDATLLDAVWHEAASLHRARIAHRALRAGNILVSAGRPVIIDFGFAEESAEPRLRAIDRAELLASLAALVGPEPVIASALSHVGPDDLAASVPYLQPLALSAFTRAQVSKSLLKGLRDGVAEATEQESQPLERLVRVRPRTVLTIAALAGAFYVLLPQLANVPDSLEAVRSANWAWLLVCVLMSVVTYVSSAIGTTGGVNGSLPFVATVQAQVASSFVNRVTPANVGGMALNVRFMQKAGVAPAEAVAGMGLNVVAGGIVHAVLLVVFLAWAGQGGGGAFTLPASSKVLAGLAIALALAGLFAATRRGRRLIKTHVFGFARQSWSSLVSLVRSPLRLAALFGGSLGVTLAYICALAAALAAFNADVTFAEVGAVYLGSSLIAAAAPTPGGLGALEAALVAALTGVGLESGVAVAAVLSYRLATYWLPILPGWISFRMLDRRNLI